MASPPPPPASASASSSSLLSNSTILLPPPFPSNPSSKILCVPCRNRPLRCSTTVMAIVASSSSSSPRHGSDALLYTCLSSSARRPASFTVSSTSGSDQTLPSKEDQDGEGAVGCYDRVIPRSPSPEIDPKDVVYAQLRALQAGDLATVFEFASPKNKSHTGPLPRFTEMIQGRAYNIMIGHATAEVLSTLNVTPERFQQRVLITGVNGRQTTFSWSLSKQEADPYQGCWMTDSVHRDE